MRFVICLLTCVAYAHATITTTSTAELSRSPHYVVELRIEHVQQFSNVKMYIPFNYQVQPSDIVVVPSETMCTWTTRHIFDEEVSSGTCFVDSALPLLAIRFNGSAAFMPVRFPVKICPKFLGDGRCWTNEHIWGSPTPLEQLISCEIVALAVLIFWISVGCVLCVCMRRNLPLFQYHTHEQKCNHIVIAEESGLLDSDDDDGHYVDKPEGAADGEEA